MGMLDPNARPVLIDLPEMKFLLQPGRPILMDGAMGTELIAAGLDVHVDNSERWVLDKPETVSKIHADYAAAGADLLQTCTFGALRARLAPHGLSDRVSSICSRAVQLARTAAGGIPVVANLGPTGLLQGNPADAATRSEIESQVAEAARALAAAGADALHLETQYHPEELLAAASGARKGAPDLPLWVSITLSIGDAGLSTPFGYAFDKMLRALADAAPEAVGLNCSLDAERIAQATERLVDSDLGPVLVRPQARLSAKCASGRSNETPARFAAHAVKLFSLGATAVGGCCGTHPACIKALANLLRQDALVKEAG
jgi:homocysteine S-methyltransferase